MESELFEQFKANNHKALETYFDRHAPALLLFANKIVIDENVAEEKIQDAYIKLWEARERIINQEHLKSFLYQTTRNSCIDHLRTNRKYFQLSIQEIKENISTSDEDLLSKIIHTETLMLVYSEVKKLPARQQKIFHLSFIDGLSTQEICEELGMTANAVFIARSKALATLRHLFKGNDPLILALYIICHRQTKSD